MAEAEKRTAYLDELLEKLETSRDEVDHWLESAERQNEQVKLIAERGGDVVSFVRVLQLRRDERMAEDE